MNCVILTLDEEIEFLHLPACPDTFNDGAGHLYTKLSTDDDNGCYDWLRCETGVVIGLRWFPYEAKTLQDKRLAYLRNLKNMRVDEDFLGLTIYFSEARTIDESKSTDQDFLENVLFFTPEGKCAISFSIDNLSERIPSK